MRDSSGGPTHRPFALANNVGRLLEVRAGAMSTLEDISEMRIELMKVFDTLKDPVVCTDLRGSRVLSENLAVQMIGTMREGNPRFFRNAVLVKSPVLGLQLGRLIRESNNPRRKVFDDIGELELWLRPFLNEPEIQRLHLFLSEFEEEAPTNGSSALPSNN